MTALSAAAAALPVSQWATVKAMPDSVFWTSGQGTQELRTTYAWELHYVRNRLLFTGGPHDGASAEIDYDEASDSVVVRSPIPGLPSDLHGYGHTGTNGSDYRTRVYAYHDPSVYDFDWNTNVWNWHSWADDPSQNWASTHDSFCHFDGKWYFFGGASGILEQPDGSTTWTLIASTGQSNTFNPHFPTGDNEVWSVVTTDYLLFGSDTRMYARDRAGVFTTRAAAPINLHSSGAIAVSDPVTGHMLAWDDSSGWEYDPVADTWSPLSVPLPSNPAGVNGLVAGPVAAHGVIAWLVPGTGLMIYRHASSTPVAPSEPQNLRVENGLVVCDPDPNADKYGVSVDGRAYWEYDSPLSFDPVPVLGASPDGTYSLEVYAVNPVGASPKATTTITKTTPPPTQPPPDYTVP